jgi:hypothetical protein
MKDQENTMEAGGRTELWMKSLQNIVRKPYGWSYHEFGFSHNIWLDIARVGGVVSFLIFLVFTIRAFFTIHKSLALIKDNSLRIMVLAYGIAFLLVCSVEPILDANPYYLPLFCFYIGVFRSFIEEKKHTILT